MIKNIYVSQVDYSISEVSYESDTFNDRIKDYGVYIIFYKYNDFITFCYSDGCLDLKSNYFDDLNKPRFGSFMSYQGLYSARNKISYCMFTSFSEAITSIIDDKLLTSLLFNIHYITNAEE